MYLRQIVARINDADIAFATKDESQLCPKELLPVFTRLGYKI